MLLLMFYQNVLLKLFFHHSVNNETSLAISLMLGHVTQWQGWRLLQNCLLSLLSPLPPQYQNMTKRICPHISISLSPPYLYSQISSKSGFHSLSKFPFTSLLWNVALAATIYPIFAKTILGSSEPMGTSHYSPFLISTALGTAGWLRSLWTSFVHNIMLLGL